MKPQSPDTNGCQSGLGLHAFPGGFTVFPILMGYIGFHNLNIYNYIFKINLINLIFIILSLLMTTGRSMATEL